MSNMAYKYRVYPTEEQELLFAKTFGCCRKVWNLMLADKIAWYKEHKESLYVTPAQYKKEYPYLKEVDSLALANVQLQLTAAYRNFFRDKRVGFPKFKSRRRSRASYTTNNQNGTVEVTEDHIRLPKAGSVKAVIHRRAPENWKLKSATVSRDRDGKYFISVLYEYDDAPAAAAAEPTKILGLDYKSDGLYVDSEGHRADMPRFYHDAEKRLAREQKKLSRRMGSRKGEKESEGHRKQRLKVAKLHSHVRNQRLDYLHKQSRRIADEYDLVCVETLNLRAMGRHHSKGLHLGKSVAENGYGTFLNLLDYKLAGQGKSLVKVDRFYASSQICHNCGYKNPKTKDLSVRRVTCPVCGASYDRDINAAQNIRDEGLRIYKETGSSAV